MKCEKTEEFSRSESILSSRWKTIDGNEIRDIAGTLSALLEGSEKTVHVGTDSQQIGKKTAFVTVIAVLDPGKGGRAFYLRERVPRIESLRERLHREVWLSVETSLAILELGHVSQDRMTVHVDANPDERFKSSDYVKELAGSVASQGFGLLLKPDSWASTHVADRAVKRMRT